MTDRPTATIKTGDLTVKYSHVATPDTKFNAEGEYKITVLHDVELEAKLQKLADEWNVDQPFVKTLKDGEKVIASKSKYAPKMFTAEDVTARSKGSAGLVIRLTSTLFATPSRSWVNLPLDKVQRCAPQERQ